MNYIDPTGHFLGSLFAWVGKVVIGGVVNAVVDTGVRLLTGQEVSLKTIGSSFVEGCVASAVGTGTAKLASKATSVAGKYAINKAGGAAARTAVGVIRGDSAKDIVRSVSVGFLADNVLDGVSSQISKIRTQRANAKATSTKPLQTHHYATNKNKSYTPTFKKIANKYGLDLDGKWNKKKLPHQGRHPNEYHDYVLKNMRVIDKVARGNKTIFKGGYTILKWTINTNPEMLYKNFWRKK